jgi:protein-tyrosine phosphatase
MEVLCLCTANLCRSPIAARLLERYLAAEGAEAHVVSAGRGPEDQPSPPQTIEVMAGLGVDLAAHRSQVTTREMLGRADLVLGMAREHVRDAVALDADAWERAFTLKEIVRRGEAVGPRLSGEGLRSWLRRVGQGRPVSALLGSARSDDVADPVGGPMRSYRRTARELDALTARLAVILA